METFVPADRFAELRQKHPELVYERFEIRETPETYELGFEFSLSGGPVFHPTFTLPRPAGKEPIDPKLLENLVFHIGMIESISYWKTACPPVVRVKAGHLNAEQCAAWKNLYFHGLSEFFYRNGLVPDMETLVRFECAPGAPIGAIACEASSLQLIPVGGGKDSIVTLRILERLHPRNLCFFLNATKAQEESARIFGYGPEQIVSAKRRIDPALLELNRNGYWNGHTPFSAMLAFITILVGAVYGTRYIALSNESSASDPTVAGSTINHQYSKSWNFERDFSAYVERYLTPSIHYFSLLRPWNELQIARWFAKELEALPVFRSCNVGSKEDRWCGTCPKCLFVDILLSPFIGAERRATIFGGLDQLPLEKAELRAIFDQLIGITPVKPFECVGTVEEVRAALSMTLSKSEKNGTALPTLLRYFQESHPECILPFDKIEALLGAFHTPHRVPKAFLTIV